MCGNGVLQKIIHTLTNMSIIRTGILIGADVLQVKKVAVEHLEDIVVILSTNRAFWGFDW